MAEWYVQREEEDDLGPLRPGELLTLVRKGTVVAETMIRKDDSAWFPASEVGGLFEAARRPTIEHYCPECDVRVNAPPTVCPNCLKELAKTRTRIIEHGIGEKRSGSASSSSGPSVSARRWLQKRMGKDKE